MVTLLCLSNDVKVDAVLSNGINVNFDSDVASLESSNNRRGILLANANNRSIVAKGSTESTGQRARDVVVNDGSSSTSLLGVDGLLGKGTLSSRDESDVALDLGRKISSVATKAVNLDERTLGLATRSIGQDLSGDIVASNVESSSTSRV